MWFSLVLALRRYAFSLHFFILTTNNIKPNSESPFPIKDKRSRSGGPGSNPLPQAPGPTQHQHQLPQVAWASQGQLAARDCSRVHSRPSFHREIRSPVAGVRSVRWRSCLPGAATRKVGRRPPPPQVEKSFQMSFSGKGRLCEKSLGIAQQNCRVCVVRRVGVWKRRLARP